MSLIFTSMTRLATDSPLWSTSSLMPSSSVSLSSAKITRSTTMFGKDSGQSFLTRNQDHDLEKVLQLFREFSFFIRIKTKIKGRIDHMTNLRYCLEEKKFMKHQSFHEFPHLFSDKMHFPIFLTFKKEKAVC